MRSNFSRRLSSCTAALLWLGGVVSFSACTKTVVVTVPPRVDLHAYRCIGVVHFGVEGRLPEEEDVTHRFLATLQAAQPGVRLLELGPQPEVLQSVGCQDMDLRAIRAIGQHFGVDAVLTGELLVSDVKPNLSVSPSLSSVSARASVNGSLQAKIRETSNGATVWTNGAHGTWNLASFGLNSQGMPSHAGLSDPHEKQRQMLSDLVRVATNDFRPTYEKHKVAD